VATATGCSTIQRILKADDPKTFATARALIKEQKYVEAADELRRLKATYDFNPRGRGGLSMYGDLVEDVVRELATDPMSRIESAAKGEWNRAKAIKLATLLPANFRRSRGCRSTSCGGTSSPPRP
jgi:hypothetical protein